MSTPQEREAEDRYEAQNDSSPEASADVTDNSYIPATNTGEAGQVPIVSDQAGAEELDNQPPRNLDSHLCMPLS